jgi:hypothetical protein
MGYPVSKNYMDEGGDRWTIGPGGELVIQGAVLGAEPVQGYFVDTTYGSDTANDGKSWARPFATMAKALTTVLTGGTIRFRGDVREEITGSNLKFDITIIGCSSLHHPDLPAAGYDPGAACWRPPVSPTTATPLLKVRGRGWKFINFMVDCPVDAPAFKLERNALEGVLEYDASHASFLGIRALAGQNFVEDAGGCYNVTIDGCQIAMFSAAAIINTSTAVANPLNWKILNNIFPADTSDFGNVTHVDSPLNSAIIAGNIFGKVRSTAKYIDLTGGNNNIVTGNVLGGEYDTSNYVPGTGDEWMQNICAVTSVTAPDGRSIAVPAA